MEFDLGRLCDGIDALRPLASDDAELMLEWMHDSAIASVFQVDFAQFRLEDAKGFIAKTSSPLESFHLAVCDEDNEYLGTVSLKHIDQFNSNAEFAIVTRAKAHGTGVAAKATEGILKVAFERLGLHRVYFNVLECNGRAIAFYEKFGFRHEGVFREHLLVNGVYEDLHHYGMTTDDYAEWCRRKGQQWQL